MCVHVGRHMRGGEENPATFCGKKWRRFWYREITLFSGGRCCRQPVSHQRRLMKWNRRKVLWEKSSHPWGTGMPGLRIPLNTTTAWDWAASFCGDCQARSKALDSGSSHEGVRGFESHPPHLLMLQIAVLLWTAFVAVYVALIYSYSRLFTLILSRSFLIIFREFTAISIYWKVRPLYLDLSFLFSMSFLFSI